VLCWVAPIDCCVYKLLLRTPRAPLAHRDAPGRRRSRAWAYFPNLLNWKRDLKPGPEFMMSLSFASFAD
jgi:hypothetical protein